MKRLFLVALASTACSEDPTFDHVRWTPLTSVAKGTMLSALALTIPEEATLGTRVEAIDSDGDLIRCAPDVFSQDEDTLFVEPAERGSFLFIGVTAGRTTIVVLCGSEPVYLDGIVVGSP